jgi:glyoxylase-like metal-dependent hydrolase (beta-lactamase superfamily II)
MKHRTLVRLLIGVLVLGLGGFLAPPAALPSAAAESPTDQPETLYSAWMLESCTLMGYPVSALTPHRGLSSYLKTNEITFDVPVNYNVIKGGGRVVVYDTGWKQQQYIQAFDCQNWAHPREQLGQLGIRLEDVDMVVLGHGHWDHSGSVDEFPNATMYIQGEELRYIEWAINYPNPKISETVCGRRPACGYPPDILDGIYGKIRAGKARIVEGEDTIAPGLTIHPAFRAHTPGSQLLQVHTARGELVFGSDAYSSWTSAKDYEPANIQQADTVQQVLAYERGFRIAGTWDNLISAHEPLSYTAEYPITARAWVGPNGSRAAELVLAPGEPSRVPGAAAVPAPAQIPR